MRIDPTEIEVVAGRKNKDDKRSGEYNDGATPWFRLKRTRTC